MQNNDPLLPLQNHKHGNMRGTFSLSEAPHNDRTGGNFRYSFFSWREFSNVYYCSVRFLDPYPLNYQILRDNKSINFEEKMEIKCVRS